MQRKLLSILLATLFAGCAADVDAKGDEDELPADGKADSFRSPTEHGNLPFGIASNANLNADERFHAWEFALGGDASVAIEVASGNPNLDTVAYLYHRTESSENWGRYIRRNDDASSTQLTSAISGDFGAGQYRVIVKGFKLAHVGDFSVTADCTGECGSVEPIEYPTLTGFGAGCADSIRELFVSDTVNESSLTVALTDIGSLSGPTRVAIELYTERFGDEFADYDVEDLAVETTSVDNGEIISVDFGADEATIYYFFDRDSELLASYWSNQSPIVDFYCATDSGSDPEPDAECVSGLLYYGPHLATVESDEFFEFELGGNNTSLPDFPRVAAEAYVTNVLGGDDQAVAAMEMEVHSWDGGARVIVSVTNFDTAEYGPAEYWFDDYYVSFQSYDGASAMLCERIN